MLLVAIALVQLNAEAQFYSEENPFAHTFSIVARDSITGDMAVGVQSHWFSVGTIVSWGRSGVGVVATQSFVNPAYGPNGLDLMSRGHSAEEALRILVEADRGRDYRQLAFLDANGSVSAYTGSSCIASASHAMGKDYSVQANMMLNDDVVPAMSKAFIASGHPLFTIWTTGSDSLSERKLSFRPLLGFI